MNDSSDRAMPERMWWLPPLVILVNLGVVGLVITYSIIGLKPLVPPHEQPQLVRFEFYTFVVAVLLPTAITTAYLWPVFAWLRRLREKRPEDPAIHVPADAVVRGANAPVNLAAFCLATWVVLGMLLFFQVWTTLSRITIALGMHFFILRVLAGVIAAASVYFLAEYICRTYAWPALFVNTPIEGNPRLWKVRVVHRLFLQMVAISFLPLGAVTFIALSWMTSSGAGLDRLTAAAAADPILFRVILVILLIGVSAAFGGAWLAWLVAQSINRPLRRLERAMASLRGGNLSVRVPVASTDEIGAVEEGFNLTALRLAESYEALEARNDELAEALDRIALLERVKRGLDRFVPDTVRRRIEENPDAPGLEKAAKDVTVLFLDIEGYTRLSEELPREKLNELIEHHFSLYLSDIQEGDGDINETAGDGLMILFQHGNPDEHAHSAVRTALSISMKTATANGGASDIPASISVNMGISSGVCHVGSTQLKGLTGERWTFTATGPVTNLAARLGDHARAGQVLLSHETAQRVKARFGLKRVGRVSLKNLSEPVGVWELEGGDEVSDDEDTLIRSDS